jgi:hypothetical protein
MRSVASAKIIAINVGNKLQDINVNSPLAHLTYPTRSVLVPSFLIMRALQVTRATT